MNDIVLRPSYWASVSGGKDSLYMLYLILRHLDKYPLNGVVHFELEIDYPFIKNVIDYMESECNNYGIKFVRIKPRKSWKELYDKYGFPTRQARWCNSSYKMDAVKQVEEFLKEQGCYLVSYIGYCADEEQRYSKRVVKKEVYPLVDFNINEATILEWAKTVPIFNNYYLFNRRCGCMYCPMISMTEMAYMLKFYPEHYEKLIQLAKDTEEKRKSEMGRPFSIFDRPKYNATYKDKRVRQIYLPRLEEKLQEIEGRQ